MVRSYQHVGLKKEAIDWLVMFTASSNEYTHVDLFYGDGPYLFQHIVKDKFKLFIRSPVVEIIQDVPWSGGPLAFLCLSLPNGEKLFEWSEKEISKYLEGVC